MSLRGRRHGGGRKNELVFLTTCGPATTFDPKITGPNGTWLFDDGTTIYAASGAEISKTFASDGLHRAVYRPASGGLAAITAIDVRSDSITSITGIGRLSALATCYIFLNTGLAFSLSDVPPSVTDLNLRDCGLTVAGSLASISRCPQITLNGSAVTGSLTSISRSATYLSASSCTGITGALSDLPTAIQTAILLGCTGITAASAATLTAIRDLRIYSMGWLTADVDTVLLSIANAILADAAQFTYATPVINIGGTNEAPSGTYQAPTGPGGTPTSGLEAVWIMTHNTGHAWTVTFKNGTANELLLGNVAGTGEKTWSDVGALNTRTYAQRFVANEGALSDLKIKVGGATNMKMAVYTDVAGNPGTLLAVSDEFSAVGGWNNETLNSVCSLVAGSYYWLAFKSSVSSIVYYNATGGAMAYKDTAYADAFTADFGSHSDTTADLAVGGYGLKVV